MSPEQARGQAVDKRTDIWAFGCVVYEMLTSRRAFAGATMSDGLAAILDREPDWTALPAATPAATRRLLTRCLEKDQGRRLRDIGDARLEREDLEEKDAQAAERALAVPPTLAPRVCSRPFGWGSTWLGRGWRGLADRSDRIRFEHVR